ncbi:MULTISPECIES: adenosylcobinamide-GDP ribazoletransferase [Myroides]|uniref:Adenosylcobinamide-GDP ribazoletransferase n=2 Tax=Myroides odoratimimus TaxID=76832 RepID=A0AAI8C5S6_9FLAO|nr:MULTISPECIES: adenosylcobinamide-GDP ribazoletransferase [Myroides]ALU26440.1 cobalamin synthase [Myroides odoratimimus]EHO12073.1 cobalamin 5'-phosphate synthase [Myroides odoratimimus CCUG 10230]MCS7473938.1 adenosylcobinamide-GDP ribazoletransferase [Myroides odoratimimus]MDM1034294.1 adenosylcobinamide-GDP ribazoletransferase [Myroides odoratimimus]MDM1037761.1 adenosylcobinamide-GDP ribazoletransferase [Myroides odoratimimus]
MIRKELTYFLTAVMFFTRIPIPFKVPYSHEIMNKSQKYFPLIGYLVGGMAVLVYWVTSYLFSADIAIVLSMVSTVLLTGAFHEDGFTDVCDSFGGGYGKEKIMTIMKDSRIGAYGVIGIVLLLLLKFLALHNIAELSTSFLLVVMLNGHITSRFHAATAIYTHRYVRDTDDSKSKPMANQKLSYSSLLFSLILAIVPYILFDNWLFIIAFFVSYIGKIYLTMYFKKHIGGYTGDCLGTIQQVCEALFYLTTLTLWKFL